jgi:hypothetical protein
MGESTFESQSLDYVSSLESEAERLSDGGALVRLLQILRDIGGTFGPGTPVHNRCTSAVIQIQSRLNNVCVREATAALDAALPDLRKADRIVVVLTDLKSKVDG